MRRPVLGPGGLVRTTSSLRSGRDPRALFSMTVGNPETSGKHLFLRVTEEPFISHRCCAKELKPSAKMLRRKVGNNPSIQSVWCTSASRALWRARVFDLLAGNL
jgi:hypothetical protein